MSSFQAQSGHKAICCSQYVHGNLFLFLNQNCGLVICPSGFWFMSSLCIKVQVFFFSSLQKHIVPFTFQNIIAVIIRGFGWLYTRALGSQSPCLWLLPRSAEESGLLQRLWGLPRPVVRSRRAVRSLHGTGRHGLGALWQVDLTENFTS